MRGAISVSGRERPGAPVERWLARTLAVDPPRAKSLIVTVWGDSLAPHGGALRLRALIDLAETFGIAERNVRTSVYRLAAEGWLRGEALGRERRYRLTPSGRHTFAAAYRRIYFPHLETWDRRWQLALVAPESLDARERVALRETLAWSGFCTLAPGVHARPRVAHRGAIAVPAASLAKVTLLASRDETGPGGTPLAARAADLYALDAMAASYRAFIARYTEGFECFRARDVLDPQHCFAARTLLIHAFRRVMLRDPLLPTALLPPQWAGIAAYALTRDFYRLLYRPADAWLAATLGADWKSAAPEFQRRFGGLALADRPPPAVRQAVQPRQ
ncbi:MAG: PaaX family transcriptional regulator C-terminal domain-containing protein [Casimicrobiaceae bacterium]